MIESIEVTKYFGGLAAIKNVDFMIKEGEIVGLIGPNGAGKTTMFNLLSGIYAPTSGTMRFEGRDITGLKPYQICHLGIGRTFQIPKPFSGITTLENVITAVLFGKPKPASLTYANREALKMLEFTELIDNKDSLAASLTLANRKRLEIARALATKPRLILLDEVIAGLNPTETEQALNLMRKIRAELGITVFWIEHVMKAIMETSDRVIVLHHGEKIIEGPPKEVANDERVIEAYLG